MCELYVHETPTFSHYDGGDQMVTNNPIRKKRKRVLSFFLFFYFSEYGTH